MLKKLLLILPLALSQTVSAESTELNQQNKADYEELPWQQPDCSQFSSYKKCQNSTKLKYRKMRQKEMRSHGLSFDYFERPGFEGAEVGKALKDKVSGALIVTFDVIKNGNTQNVKVKAASSEQVMVYAKPLIDAIKLWTFVPVDEVKGGVQWHTEIFFEPEACKEEPKEGVEKKDCYAKD